MRESDGRGQTTQGQPGVGKKSFSAPVNIEKIMSECLDKTGIFNITWVNTRWKCQENVTLTKRKQPTAISVRVGHVDVRMVVDCHRHFCRESSLMLSTNGQYGSTAVRQYGGTAIGGVSGIAAVDRRLTNVDTNCVSDPPCDDNDMSVRVTFSRPNGSARGGSSGGGHEPSAQWWRVRPGNGGDLPHRPTDGAEVRRCDWWETGQEDRVNQSVIKRYSLTAAISAKPAISAISISPLAGNLAGHPGLQNFWGNDPAERGLCQEAPRMSLAGGERRQGHESHRSQCGVRGRSVALDGPVVPARVMTSQVEKGTVLDAAVAAAVTLANSGARSQLAGEYATGNLTPVITHGGRAGKSTGRESNSGVRLLAVAGSRLPPHQQLELTKQWRDNNCKSVIKRENQAMRPNIDGATAVSQLRRMADYGCVIKQKERSVKSCFSQRKAVNSVGGCINYLLCKNNRRRWSKIIFKKGGKYKRDQLRKNSCLVTNYTLPVFSVAIEKFFLGKTLQTEGCPIPGHAEIQGHRAEGARWAQP